MTTRGFSPLDHFIGLLDQGLRTVFGRARHGRSRHPASRDTCTSLYIAERESPAAGKVEADLDATERELAGRLMRINHAGEICAQALYQGQAVTAKLPNVREKMEQAANEENDHLAWTEERLHEMGTHTSYLNPLWYAGSFAIGALAGLAGDKWSLGFVAETEKQVVRHLDGHLVRLPKQDEKSRAILEQMRADEGRHATVALEAGAAFLPQPIKRLMRLTSKIMTQTAYWI